MLKFMIIFMMFNSTNTEAGHLPELLEEEIPFDISVSETPTKYCSPIDLTVERTGNDNFNWLIMDGEEAEHKFNSFDDLYYQCDGPSCFMVKIADLKDAPRHMCLK